MSNGGPAILRGVPGLRAKIARELGFTRAAVLKWDRVPAEYVVRVEEIAGIPRHKLRPDLHHPPPAEAA